MGPSNGQEVLKIKILELAKNQKVGDELWAKNILSSCKCFFFLVDNSIVGGGGVWTMDISKENTK